MLQKDATIEKLLIPGSWFTKKDGTDTKPLQVIAAGEIAECVKTAGQWGPTGNMHALSILGDGSTAFAYLRQANNQPEIWLHLHIEQMNVTDEQTLFKVIPAFESGGQQPNKVTVSWRGQRWFIQDIASHMMTVDGRLPNLTPGGRAACMLGYNPDTQEYFLWFKDKGASLLFMGKKILNPNQIVREQ